VIETAKANHVEVMAGLERIERRLPPAPHTVLHVSALPGFDSVIETAKA
jgi:hypothetical protein